MRVLLFYLLLCYQARGEPWNEFVHAVHMVETGGRLGPIVGDKGRALGPLQIHESYWFDSGARGQYKDVTDLQFASKVMRAYLQRYARNALKNGDWKTCARIHNGGKNGNKKSETLAYWNKVKKHLTKR